MDGRPDRSNKVPFSNSSAEVWTGALYFIRTTPYVTQGEG